MVFVLVLAFGLHGAIHHEHPEEHFGSNAQAVFHGEDKKFFLALGILAAALWASKFPAILQPQALSGYAESGFKEHVRPRLVLFRILREGILHPKLCG